MSFEIFDYTNTIIHYNNKLNILATQLNNNQYQLSLLQGAPYQTIVGSTIANITLAIAEINTTIQNIQLILDEITQIQLLSLQDKEQLYYYYTVVNDNIINFMGKMLFNTSRALSDVDIQTLINDTTTPDPVRLEVAKIIYDQYQIYQPLYLEIITGIL